MRFIGTVVLLTLVGVLAAHRNVLAQDSVTVKEIVFTGNSRIDDSSLRYSIRTKVGQRFSESKLAEDVTTLYAFYRRVTHLVDRQPDGIRIEFIVEENPEISSVVFRGFSALKVDEAKEIVESKEGYPYAEFKVQRDRQLLVEALKEKGNYFAEVKVAVGDYGVGKQILFTAIEGPEVSVGTISFEGNFAFDDDTLADKMVLEESGLFTSGKFQLLTLEQDLISVANFYRSEGYLDAIVALKALGVSDDKEDVAITVTVEEGEPYILDRVTIEGGTSFPEDRSILNAIAQLETGRPRREEDLVLAQAALRNYYLENAFYAVRVNRSSEEDSIRHTSHVIFKITEGDPVRIRRIDITGNTLTKDEVIRRELTIHPTGPLNSIELAKSRNRLEGLNYFTMGSVQAQVKDTDDPYVKDVEISLEEGRTGSVKFSLGLTSDLGLLGLLEISKRNFDIADFPKKFGDAVGGRAFTGGGQQLDLTLAPGTDYSQYRIAFTEPWMWGEYVFYGPSGGVEETPFSFGVDLYYTLFARFDYDEGRTGIGVRTGKFWRKPSRNVDDIFRAGVGFRMENVRLDNLGTNAPPGAYYWEGLNRYNKLTFDFGWTHFDRPQSPGDGWDVSLNYTLGGGPLGGEIDFNKIEVGTSRYFTIYKTKRDRRHILFASVRVGWAAEFGDNPEVPLFERFYAGGIGTVRGFEFGEVGPRARGNPFTEEGREEIERSLAAGEGDPLGGEALWLFRTEYGFPLYEDLLRGVVFLDAGNVALRWGDDLWKKSRVAAGLGFRVRVPFFGPTPIAFDFAWPIKQELNDGTQVLSFSIDRPF